MIAAPTADDQALLPYQFGYGLPLMGGQPWDNDPSCPGLDAPQQEYSMCFHEYPDMNGDGVINGYELIIMMNGMTNGISSSDPQFIKADLNGDGIVNGADLSMLISQYGPTISGRIIP
tara:strand:- start:8155 stop:8508 length:354 start_codon:yes stop_codon:yes gene_type:complete